MKKYRLPRLTELPDFDQDNEFWEPSGLNFPIPNEAEGLQATKLAHGSESIWDDEFDFQPPWPVTPAKRLPLDRFLDRVDEVNWKNVKFFGLMFSASVVAQVLMHLCVEANR